MDAVCYPLTEWQYVVGIIYQLGASYPASHFRMGWQATGYQHDRIPVGH